MKKIITIGASTSKNSINKTFANYVASQLNDIEIISVDISNFNNLPIFSVDFESENETPQEISILNSLFKDVDGFIISFAEHNGSFSAGYKNVFDWISRQEGKVFNDKPALLLSTSPGGRGGSMVLSSATDVYPHQGAIVTGSFSLPSFFENFKENTIVNSELNEKLNVEINKFQETIK